MTSQRELAKTERELFDAATPTERASRSCARFIAAMGGGTVYEVERRQTIYLAGAEAEPLWAELDRGMSLSTAANLLRGARKSGRTLADVLAHYRANGFELRSVGGRMFRRKAQGAPAEYDPQAIPPAAPPVEAPSPPAGNTALDRVRSAVREWIAVTIPEGDGELEAVSETVWAEMRAVIERTEDRLRRLRGRASGAERGPSRADLREACALLGLPVPKSGQGLDMAIARRAQRRLLAAAHPDTSGSDDTVDAFHAVNAAFAIVTAYQDHLTNGKKETHRGNDRNQGPAHDPDQAP